MFNQWISRHRYSPVRSEDSEAATKPPLQIPVPRRVRTALGLALLMIVVFFFFRSPVLETRYHITTAAPTQYQNATLVPTTDCLPPGPEPVHDDVNWGDFAYVQYVTNEKYLCNSLMIFEALYRLNAKADLLMLYPQNWQVPDNDGSESEYESKLLAEARDLYKVILKPIEVRTYENKKDPTWEDSYTKLLVFEQTQYKRVILVDSDATILQVSTFCLDSCDMPLMLFSTWTSFSSCLRHPSRCPEHIGASPTYSLAKLSSSSLRKRNGNVSNTPWSITKDMIMIWIF